MCSISGCALFDGLQQLPDDGTAAAATAADDAASYVELRLHIPAGGTTLRYIEDGNISFGFN